MRNTRGDLSACPKGLITPEGGTRGGQRSAEGIVVAAHGGEGPNVKGRKGTRSSRDEGGADRTFVSLSRTMAERPEDSRRVAGGTRKRTERERQASPAEKGKTRPKAEDLLEEVLRRENLLAALHRVRSNQGAPGVDGMTVEALVPYLKENWPRIREELRDGRYHPAPVRQADIPKPEGKGRRSLGIPTVLDRLIVRLRLTKSSKPSCRCSVRSSIPTSAKAATASVPGGAVTMRWQRLAPTWRRAIVSWWTSIWNSSSTG